MTDRSSTDAPGMSSRTATVLTPDESAAASGAPGFGPVAAYLLTINPFVNLRRWIVAQVFYWGALLATAFVLAVFGWT